MPTTDQTVTVTYVGTDPFLYGRQLIRPGDKIDLPADEVEAWGTETPPAFQK